MKDMSNISTANLFQQMQLMTAQAEGIIANPEHNNISFGQALDQAFKQVSDLNNKADESRTRYEFGDTEISIGEVMIDTQKSNLALEATTRVKNKILQAYQDIMSMPV